MLKKAGVLAAIAGVVILVAGTITAVAPRCTAHDAVSIAGIIQLFGCP